MVMALIEAGFTDHLTFSADATSGYAKTITVFLPKLKAVGRRTRFFTRLCTIILGDSSLSRQSVLARSNFLNFWGPYRCIYFPHGREDRFAAHG